MVTVTKFNISARGKFSAGRTQQQMPTPSPMPLRCLQFFMTFRFQIYLLSTLAILSILSCKTKSPIFTSPTNDTTAALSILLNKDFLGRHMPGYGALQKPSPFGDTIIFKIDSITAEHLPESINGFHFKFLTKDQICDLATTNYTDTTYFPNFLQLNRFQKQDSTYDIALQVTCVLPLYDKSGKKLFVSDTTNYKCKFGILCGGGIGVTVYKEHDTLKIRRESSWSN
jgi:hypothetical protein